MEKMDKMKSFYVSGTIGDAYVILCKLYAVAKKEKILCSHRTAYEELEPIIRDIYSLLPNINVQFRKSKSTEVEICGAFRFPEQKTEQDEYNLYPEYYPEFELGDIGHFSLPPVYETLQIKAGSHGDRSLLPDTINRILNGSSLPVVLIGENTSLPTESFNAMDLRDKSSVKEVVGIIKNGKRFYGPLGLLSFIAVSHKVMSEVYIKSELDVSAIKSRIEAVEEWRKFLIRR